MPSADDPQQTKWQWADVDGSRHSASLAELTQLFESGALPAYTLVWQAGWAEWLEGRECELFADCIPAAQRKPTREAQTDAEYAELPPEPPLDRYASEQKQSALRALLGTAAAPPPPPPSSPLPSSASGSAAALVGRAASSSQAPPPPPGERPSSPPSERRAPIPSAPHITPPPADIKIKTLPDLDHAEELEAEPEEDSSAHASVAELDPDELKSEVAIPEVTPDAEEAEELEPEELESDIAAAPSEGRSAESKRKVASAAALIGGGSSSATPPPPASARPSAPPTSKPAPASAAALLSSGSASVPGPRASQPPTSSSLPAAGPASAGPQSGPPMSAPAPMPAPASGPSNSNIILGALVIGLLAVVVILLMNQRSSQSTSTEVVVSSPQTNSSAKTEKPNEASKGPCKVAVEPKKLLDSAYLGVAPRAIAISAEKVTLGLAKDSKVALGLDVSLGDLSTQQAFEERAPGKVVAVTPTPDHRFLVTHDRQKRDGAVEFSSGMTIGARGSRLEVVRNGKATELGTLPSDEVTTPSVERAQDSGKSYALVLRSGGQEGKLVFGWLDGEGALKGTLGAVSMQDAFLGTPSVTTSDANALITVATRPTADAYWGITLASAALHQPPKSSKSFTPPPGGPGGEAISPAASALGQGRWVLMWTEGPRGKHQVRAQTLDADLIPSGPAVRLSAADSDAGQGTLIASGDRALAVFFVRTPGGAELWGTGLSCQ
ncbi:MAG: DUF4339 domain-containing protein [Polyangiaceae bacterium]|nr:DUF4339 domain-containing protein [Myxococcales bacterium]MCB9589533.1 DUF4339 domain-containing protein [Polyangiaceae bacterium]MCB9609161.1 DUF4339 domain-containing protein [Polyangiaceae bacterium]